MFAKDCGPHFVLFVHKGLRSLLICFNCKGRCPYFCFCLQRIVVLVFCYSFCCSFTKDCGLLFSAIHSQRTAVLVYLFRLQRTAVLIFPSVYKRTASLSCAIHLQRTAALVLCYPFAKDCCPCLEQFICKGLRSLS